MTRRIALTTQNQPSPFHPGEIELQRRLGKAEDMSQLGRRMVHDHLPRQHRDFYRQLPFLVVASVDAEGAPWASIVAGGAGFATSPDPGRLSVKAKLPPGDPLRGALAHGAQLGVLGIELGTRRRNRMNGRAELTAEGFDIVVQQAFGNCPQYIHTRSFQLHPASEAPPPAQRLDGLDAPARRLIEEADTFFVASHTPGPGTTHGADASHRGGRPGFVRIDESGALVVPDFHGNHHFNTLGNFLVNPRGGVTFVDFETGELLMLTGRTEVLWDGTPELKGFVGAERAWRLTPERVLRLSRALPIRSEPLQASPHALATGTWAEADEMRAAEALRKTWRRYRVDAAVDEAEAIRSFVLAPETGRAPRFQPGQHVVVRAPGGPAPRSYSLSSGPADAALRLSVKKAAAGGLSDWMHANLAPGAYVELRGPQGRFTLEETDRPLVLLSAGIGITPMMSMLRHMAAEGPTGVRRTTFIHVARRASTRPFREESLALARASGGALAVHSLLTQPGASRLGQDYELAGRLDAEALRALLPRGDYDFYLCGPAGFMQTTYEILRSLGIRDARIFAESFGPSRLERRPDEGGATPEAVPEATTALVKLARSRREKPWTPEQGSLLELAESAGLTPEHGCRSGSCGSCATRRLSGRTTYRHPVRAPVGEDEVLICCAVPAEDETRAPVVLDL